jgi:hypothetical protein
MYVYLSGTYRYVVLPTATELQPVSEASEVVSFLDEKGIIIAIFRRQDVFMYSRVEITVQGDDVVSEDL